MCTSSKWHQLKENHSVKNLNSLQIDQKQVRNWLNDGENIRSLKHSKNICRYGKEKFPPVMQKELYTKFLEMQKESRG